MLRLERCSVRKLLHRLPQVQYSLAFRCASLLAMRTKPMPRRFLRAELFHDSAPATVFTVGQIRPAGRRNCTHPAPVFVGNSLQTSVFYWHTACLCVCAYWVLWRMNMETPRTLLAMAWLTPVLCCLAVAQQGGRAEVPLEEHPAIAGALNRIDILRSEVAIWRESTPQEVTSKS
jgi:hypothetical protein